MVANGANDVSTRSYAESSCRKRPFEEHMHVQGTRGKQAKRLLESNRQNRRATFISTELHTLLLLLRSLSPTGPEVTVSLLADRSQDYRLHRGRLKWVECLHPAAFSRDTSCVCDFARTFLSPTHSLHSQHTHTCAATMSASPEPMDLINADEYHEQPSQTKDTRVRLLTPSCIESGAKLHTRDESSPI